MSKIFLVLGFGMIIVCGFVFGSNNWKGVSDFRLGIVTNDGLEMVAISRDRGMINVFQTGLKQKVWIPGGLGWYDANKLKKVLEQENKQEKLRDVFVWNYGFLPTKVISLNKYDEWAETQNLLKILGGWGWLIYNKLEESSIFKVAEIVETELDEVMPRDMADSRLINSEVWVKVLNSSDSSGLAGFVANRLSWAGLGVLSAENAPNIEINENCLISVNNKTDVKKEIEVIEDVLGKCQQSEDGEVLEGEIIVSVGQKMSSMIKYSSYVGTF